MSAVARVNVDAIPAELRERQKRVAAKIAAADAYVERGWRPLILGEGRGNSAKRPHNAAHKYLRGTSNWSPLRDNPLSPEEVHAAFDRYPAANIGLITGDGLAVADVEGNRDAPSALITATHQTPTATTPRGGFHGYFAAPCPTKTKRMVWGDLKADGGYVGSPPGVGRSWLTSFGLPLQPLPAGVVHNGSHHDDETTREHTATCRSVSTGIQDDEWVHRALKVLEIRHKGIERVHCPLHPDTRPSAGILRGNDGWVLSCRRCDQTWGLPYVYASTRGQKQLGRPSIFYWGTRLDYETGIIDLPEVALTAADGNATTQKVAEGIELALRVLLHTRREGQPLGLYLSRPFAAPWCGVGESTYEKHKGLLIDSGWLTCVGRAEDGRGKLWLPHGVAGGVTSATTLPYVAGEIRSGP